MKYLLHFLHLSTFFHIAYSTRGSNSQVSCQSAQHPGPLNPSFETGTLAGWEVISGEAFGNSSISSATSYWDGSFNQKGTFFLSGLANAGESAIGELKSQTFRTSSYLSFLVSGGYDRVNLYIGLVREQDGAVLLNQTGMNDEAFVRVTWDTSRWAGQDVYMIVYDNSTSSSWGHINLDDVRTGCNALHDDNGLTFNVLGLANQPEIKSLPSCELYAADPLRPQYHYTPYQGWINDPAGLIQWNGRHHLFSQFYPDAPLWGPMHWDHAESSDAVHWTRQPVALYPPYYASNTKDTSGRWTGSSALNNNTLHLIFTDFTDTDFHPGATPEVVSTATSTDGITFSLYPQNPIIGTASPNSPNGWRDPKVFRDPTDNNTWKLVIGSGDSAGGKVFLYRSTDLISWTYIGILFEGDGFTGTMWECPNFFPLGEKWVLFYGGRSLGWYEVGTYNGSSFTSEVRGLLDAGPDSYAMQWYKDESDRNLAIVWMGNWDTPKWPSRLNGWAGQQSVTRELFIRADGGLGFKPIAEVDSLAVGTPKTWKNMAIGDAFTIGHSTQARLQLTVDLASTTASGFTVTLFASNAEHVLVTYDIAARVLTLDTTNAGYGQAGTWQPVVTDVNGKLSLDLFMDRSTLEIFAADGTTTTATVWPRYQESQDIKIAGTGGQVMFDIIRLTSLGLSWC